MNLPTNKKEGEEKMFSRLFIVFGVWGLFLLPTSLSFAQTEQVVFLDETITYNKQELEQFAQDYPEITGETFIHPDSSYVVSDGNNDLELSCEVCKDNYYLIYAYYLYQKNGNSLDLTRKKLISAFRSINAINRAVKGGGTHFGHMYSRLYAVVEYDLASRSDSPDDYQLAKKLFIESLKQRMYDSDELLQYGSAPQESIYTQLLFTIESLNEDINSEYLLNCVIEFDGGYY